MGRRLLRFARLIVACFALVLARPAAATPAIVDSIVLIASDDDVRATSVRAEPARPRLPSLAEPSTPTPTLPSLQSPRALIADKYLRHCALLR